MDEVLKKIFEKHNTGNLNSSELQSALQEAFIAGKARALEVNGEFESTEELYDKKIAPMLQYVANICTEANIPFVAVAEYEKSNRGTTAYLPESADLSMVMINHCAKMGTNVDGYVMGLVKYAKSKGIDYQGSFVMKHAAGERK